MQGLNKCFKNLDNPTDLFSDWFLRAKKTEINDPNAVSLATANKKAIPSVRMVLMKSYSKRGFVFYTNLNSQKSNEIKKYLKSVNILLIIIAVVGTILIFFL